MRYAILSDIHSNLEALRAVLEVVDGEGVDECLCLGDVVGYGPDPEEVIEIVRERSASTVRGNHDQAAIDADEDKYFNEWAAAAAAWTRERLGEDDTKFLGDLPLTQAVDGVLLVHASPSEPRAWRYVLSPWEAVFEFAAFDEALCLIGHSHVPMFVAQTNGSPKLITGDVLKLEQGSRYIANVGSVGQPRDGDPRACFAVLDSEEGTLRLVRVEYDAEETRRKILESGLPRPLGDRLLLGR